MSACPKRLASPGSECLRQVSARPVSAIARASPPARCPWSPPAAKASPPPLRSPMPVTSRTALWVNSLPPAARKARRVSSAPDIESAGVKGVEVGLSETARVARQRMFEAGEREARFGHRARIAARQVRVEHARRKGVAGADAVDDAGDVDLGRLVAIVAQVGARRDAVVVGGDRVARGRGDELEVRSEEQTSELQSLMRIS